MQCQSCTRKRKQKLYPVGSLMVCGKCFMEPPPYRVVARVELHPALDFGCYPLPRAEEMAEGLVKIIRAAGNPKTWRVAVERLTDETAIIVYTERP